MANEKTPRPRVFESVSRRTYWIAIGSIVAVMIPLTWWAGWYAVREPEENLAAQVTTNDPLTEILYSPIGNFVVLLVFQFFAANLLFWLAMWLWLRVKR
ncbi:hypothetical protein [Algisphaera agarilytica]|uniref:Uncharacterized protein n=1 Tax=Algisphaera agarilytica TaxID=1385975 RepID=A0A7X0LJ34_9BACT|nr:hypothetical protein [Algisphaera agarilytica]MBB6428880.1 hypothetical protein [Algisphaera agarilytica]